jgi:hypothetical protein
MSPRRLAAAKRFGEAGSGAEQVFASTPLLHHSLRPLDAGGEPRSARSLPRSASSDVGFRV